MHAVLRGLCALLAIAATLAATTRSSAGVPPLGAVAAWVFAFFAATAALWKLRAGEPLRPPPASQARTWPVIAAILALAVVTRTAWIDVLPRSLFGDESRLGMYLRDTYANPVGDYFVMGWNSWPLVGMSVQGMFGPLLGLGTTTLRLSSALAGTLTVYATYLLGRELLNPRAGLIAAFFLAIGRTALDFNRLGICHSQVPLLAAFSYYFWWRGIDRGSAPSYLWAGICMGLGLYTYNAGQGIPLVWLGWVAAGVALSPSRLRRYGTGGLLVLAGFTLSSAPWLYYVTDRFAFTANWYAWTYMARDRQVAAAIMDAWRGNGPAAALAILGGQAWRTWLGFTVLPANAYQLGFQGGGMLDRVTGPLFVLGLLVSLLRWRTGRESFVLFWWLFIAVAGGVLTRDPPAFVRLVGLLPALALLAALPVDAVLRQSVPRRAVVARLVAALLLGAAAWDNWRTYFVEFAAASADDTSELAHWVRSRPADEPIFLLGADHYMHFTGDVNTQQFAFDFPDRHLEDVTGAANFLPVRRELTSPLVLVLAPTHASMAGEIRRLYPGAVVNDVRRHPDDRLFFRTVEVSPEDVESRRGLRAVVFDAEGHALSDTRRDPLATGPEVSGGARVVWTGRIYWPRWRPTQLTVRTGLPADVSIGDSVRLHVDAAGTTRVPVTLARGWHSLVVEERGPGTHALALSVGHPGRERLPRRWEFRPDAPAEGLRAVYRRDGEVIARRTEAQLNLYEQESYFGARLKVRPKTPFAAAWDGALRVDVAGAHFFRVYSNAPYVVTLDGAPLCEARGVSNPAGEACRAERVLEPGLHPFAAQWDSTTTAAWARQVFQVFWTPPGGDEELIPPGRFVPAP